MNPTNDDLMPEMRAELARLTEEPRRAANTMPFGKFKKTIPGARMEDLVPDAQKREQLIRGEPVNL